MHLMITDHDISNIKNTNYNNSFLYTQLGVPRTRSLRRKIYGKI